MGDFVSQVVKFSSQTNGREKLYRAAQYGSKLLHALLEKSTRTQELAEKLKNLESSISLSRKLLRMGKSLEFIQGALKSLHLSDIVLRMTITLARIAQACFMFIDNLLWFHSMKLLKIDKARYARLSNQFWLFSTLLSLLRNLYDILVIVRASLRKQEALASDTRRLGSGYDSTVKREDKNRRTLFAVRRCLLDNPPVLLNTATNLLDFILPSSNLGYVNVPPAVQGLVGLLSSVLGMIVVWDPALKQVP